MIRMAVPRGSATRVALLAPTLLASALLLGTTAAASAQAVPDLSAETAAARQVLESARAQDAFRYVSGAEEETVREWLSLCNASGPSGNEAERSRLLYKLFRIYGLEDVRIDDAWNVIGVRRGTGGGPTVVLNAHHDNVALAPAGQAVEAFVADGRVWCPAAGDDLMGATQMLTVLRAMNAADIQTRGDVWFVAFTGEEAPIGPEHPDASPGVERFVRANYPHNLDWRDGDILAQFHGRGGAGVGTGSIPVRHRTQLRVFAPFDRDRWGPHAVDALGRILARIGPEVRDPRSTPIPFTSANPPADDEPVLFLNMAMVHASEIISRPASEAWVRFDMRSATEARLWDAHEDIRRIAREVVTEMGPEFSFVYEINSKNGTEHGIEGWNPADNAPARMAAAAAVALYGEDPVIDASNGCGDCVRSYVEGMPAMSFTGGVVDRLGAEPAGRAGTPGSVRRASASHDVTESAEIVRLWAGIKHGLLFTVAYTGLAN